MNQVISAVLKRLRPGRAEMGLHAPPRGATASRVEPRLVPVLLASGRDDDHQILGAALANSKWRLLRASSWKEVSSLCGCVVSPVVLVDRHFQNMNWRTTIASFLDLAAAQSLILLSDVSDPYLLAELVHHGGFDVLSRPFQREEVLGTLTFAYKHAQAHWPEVVTTPANRRSPAGHVS